MEWLLEGAGTFHHDAQNDSSTHISRHSLCTGYKAAKEEPVSGEGSRCLRNVIIVVWNEKTLRHNVAVSLLSSVSLSPCVSFVIFPKVKQSHYRSGEALSYTEVWGFQISRQQVHEGGKDVSPRHRQPFPSRKYFWYSFLLEHESA
jgi:hypothetical protein